MFYSNHGHYLSLSITGSTTSELSIVAVSPCSIVCSGPGAQRYGELDERMSRKRPYRYSESGAMVQYFPQSRTVFVSKPNRSCMGMPFSLAKGHCLSGTYWPCLWPPIPYPYFIFLHFAVRFNIMDDVHTHQVTEKMTLA
jgi:hypothetical protein